MKKIFHIFLGAGLLLTAVLLLSSRETAVSAQTPQSPTGGTPTLTATEIADGFNDITAIANAGDDRLFIVEQQGTIKILNKNGSVETNNFLDIQSRVRDTAEQGLLGLAFDPDYANNGYFYVNYSYCDGSSCGAYSATTDLYTRISRFQVNDSDLNDGDENSELILMTIQQPYGNHNGGDLHFGSDGYLYIGTGDGGDGGDPENRSQTMTTLLGKMLRIDVSSGGGAPECNHGGGGNYTIPADNPYVSDNDSTCNEIWAAGLRNPWRYSFDRQTGDLYIGDVGQNAWEEVNFTPASSNGGENYGWRCYEGTHTYNTAGCQAAGNYDMPFYDYDHSSGRFSVTGGFVYRGTDSPDLQGYYIFADYGSGDFWLAQNSGGWNVTLATPTDWLEDPNTGSTIRSPVAFGEGCDGELYVADRNGNEIFKLGANAPANDILGVVFDEFVYLPIIIGGSGSPTPTCS